MSQLSVLIFSIVFFIAMLMEISYSHIIINRAFIKAGKYRNIYNTFFFVLMFLIAALRSSYTGQDTRGYYSQFTSLLLDAVGIGSYWNEIINSFKLGYFTDSIFWSFFTKLLTYVIKDGQLFLALISGIFLVSVYVVIKRYSDDPIISWIYLLGISIYVFILQGLRQSIALAIVLLSLRYISNRSLFKFLAMIFLAYLFHQSSIVFIIAYPLYRLKVSYKYFIAIGVAYALGYFFPLLGMRFLSFFQITVRFQNYLHGRSELYSQMGFLILLLIFVFCYWHKSKVIKKNPKNEFLFTLCMLGLVFQSFSGLIAEMFRISYYFSVFNMFLLSNVLSSYADEKTKATYKLLIILIFMGYFLLRSPFNYWFFFY